MSSKKKRLDVFLHQSGLCESREQAKRLIMAGKVTVNGLVASKGSLLVNEMDDIQIKADNDFVSRGGKKLEKALQVFNLDVNNRIVLDIGASTGGFTDCLLQHGAQKVYSVDVGYGQLHWKLRNNARVVVMERTNARYLKREDFEQLADGATADVAFISLTKILPAIEQCTIEEGFFVGLIKPQFEAGKDKVGKKGVVKDRLTHIEVINNICAFINNKTSFTVCGLSYSPITGPKGNIEYLVFCRKGAEEQPAIDPESIVTTAHANLLKS